MIRTKLASLLGSTTLLAAAPVVLASGCFVHRTSYPACELSPPSYTYPECVHHTDNPTIRYVWVQEKKGKQDYSYNTKYCRYFIGEQQGGNCVETETSAWRSGGPLHDEYPSGAGCNPQPGGPG